DAVIFDHPLGFLAVSFINTRKRSPARNDPDVAVLPVQESDADRNKKDEQTARENPRRARLCLSFMRNQQDAARQPLAKRFELWEALLCFCFRGLRTHACYQRR